MDRSSLHFEGYQGILWISDSAHRKCFKIIIKRWWKFHFWLCKSFYLKGHHVRYKRVSKIQSLMSIVKKMKLTEFNVKWFFFNLVLVVLWWNVASECGWSLSRLLHFSEFVFYCLLCWLSTNLKFHNSVFLNTEKHL